MPRSFSLVIFDQRDQSVVKVIPSLSRDEARWLRQDWLNRRVPETQVFVYASTKSGAQRQRSSRVSP